MFIIILPNTCFDVDKGEDEGGGKDMKNEVKSSEIKNVSLAWFESTRGRSAKKRR